MKRIIGAGFAFAVSIALTTATGCGGNGGGNGGSGGGNGGGSAAVTCLDASMFADLFTVADASFCAVAVYQADESLVVPSTMVPQVPTWGTHGGPLWFVPDASGGGITIERWSVPAEATGNLTKKTTHVDAVIPDGSFPGAQAIDTPFFGWTAISWTGAYPDTKGKIAMLANGAVAASYDVNGIYALAAVGDASSGRLLFTGVSPIGMPAGDTNAFYAADACSMPKPDLGTGTGCSASAAIAAWGDSSGPIAIDADGDAFVVLPSFADDNQEARGFAAGEVARGAKPAMGASLFTMAGFGSALAAVAPRGSDPGMLVFQPFDSMATPLDVIAQPYAVGGGVSAKGQPGKLLAMPSAGPVSLSLMTDDQNRLWVAASKDSSTTFVVIAKKP